jgi:uncharacterized protein YcaQ
MSAVITLSAAEARRVALGAQGFADRPSAGTVDRRHLTRVFDRVSVFQIDAVNVLVRSHYLPAFSRLGSYPPELLDQAAWGPRVRRRLFEYWGHEASLMPVALQPLLRWRMEDARRGEGMYGRLARFGRERADFVASVLREVERHGPLGAGDLEQAGPRGGPWWGWSDGKSALEWLFWAGLVTVAGRRGFERLYDLPGRVLPADVAAAPTPAREDAQRALVSLAAKALGIATERDLRDYFRLKPEIARARIAELVDAGALLPARVEGWSQDAYLHPEARAPRRVRVSALLSPFDSLIWERDRTERLFGFRYRLALYTPAEKREHGYYVLPFLHGDRLVARVDLKSDRQARTLRVPAAFAEPGLVAPEAMSALAATLRTMSEWLGLGEVAVGTRGDLARPLAAELGQTVPAE